MRQARDGERKAAAEQFGMIEHEGRKTILAEIHARPFLPIEAPRRIYHFAFATGEEKAVDDSKAIADLCARRGVAKPPEDAKFHHVQLADWDLRWEQHTEFSTYTWSTMLGAAEPFTHPDPLAAKEIAFLAPGPLVVATHLALIEAGPSDESLAALFNVQSLCVIGAAKGGAQVLTDFILDACGFTRLLIRSEKLGSVRAGRLVQRVLEIETYRTLALLGLPEARRAGPDLERMEREIAEINHALSETRDQRTSEDLLRRLSDLLAGSEALSTQMAFRFGASRAYHAIVKNRLDLIREAKVGSYTTISAFFSARLDPAIETCNAIEARQARLSRQVVRAIDLMRTGITFELEQQNRDLLQDMNRRARLQLRLQGFVQGFSTAALAYYLSGLTVYLAKGMRDAGWLPKNVTADMFVAMALPLTILASWSFMERVRRLTMKARKEENVN